VVHFKPIGALDLAAGYSYTRATESNGISSAASYHQFNLSQYYSLSKRTGLYAVEAYQRANGKTIGNNGVSIINATADIGDGQNSAPSSSAWASSTASNGSGVAAACCYAATAAHFVHASLSNKTAARTARAAVQFNSRCRTTSVLPSPNFRASRR
jgi:hypothetical protein